MTHIPISDNIIPQYILFSDTCNDKTYLSRPIDSQIPNALIKVGGLRGPGSTEVIHSLDKIYKSYMITIISEIVGMINSIG